jgi:DNA invertase Pin-like site-specific DNA recombinase
MLIGYARVSTRRQRLDLQHRALEAARCDLIISEWRSGDSGIGHGLGAAMECCGAGDLLVVWKLDRLGRNVMELMGVIERLRRRGAGLKVLTGAASAIDINAAEGQALFAIYAAIAAMELDMNRQRTASGRRAAPQRREIARSGSTEGKRSARRTAHPCLRLAFNGSGRDDQAEGSPRPGSLAKI